MSKITSSTINPYLTFEGNCLEAMSFYKEVFNGHLDQMPFEGSPVEVPEDYKNKILHSTLTFESAVVMASDSMPGQKVQRGDGCAITINASSLEIAEKYFNGISEGGQVIMPFDKTFWGAMFGMCVDKFGVTWMVSFETEQA